MAIDSSRMKEKLSLAWAMSCFGIDRARSRKERSMRVLEEAIELAQACGHTRASCVAQIDATFSNPSGEVKQEAAGVMVTLAAFCGLHGFDMDELFTKEFSRCIEMSGEIRAKNFKKTVAFND